MEQSNNDNNIIWVVCTKVRFDEDFWRLPQYIHIGKMEDLYGRHFNSVKMAYDQNAKWRYWIELYFEAKRRIIPAK